MNIIQRYFERRRQRNWMADQFSRDAMQRHLKGEAMADSWQAKQEAGAKCVEALCKAIKTKTDSEFLRTVEAAEFDDYCETSRRWQHEVSYQMQKRTLKALTKKS